MSGNSVWDAFMIAWNETKDFCNEHPLLLLSFFIVPLTSAMFRSINRLVCGSGYRSGGFDAEEAAEIVTGFVKSLLEEDPCKMVAEPVTEPQRKSSSH